MPSGTRCTAIVSRLRSAGRRPSGNDDRVAAVMADAVDVDADRHPLPGRWLRSARGRSVMRRRAVSGVTDTTRRDVDARSEGSTSGAGKAPTGGPAQHGRRAGRVGGRGRSASAVGPRAQNPLAGKPIRSTQPGRRRALGPDRRRRSTNRAWRRHPARRSSQRQHEQLTASRFGRARRRSRVMPRSRPIRWITTSSSSAAAPEDG